MNKDERKAYNKAYYEANKDKAEPKQPTNARPEIEEAMIVRDLSTMINKYGVEKLISALDKISKH